MLIYSIGHSTHPIERFIELLREHRIAILADVRAFPKSRRYPHFNSAELERSLTEASIRYRWFGQLGGRRHGVRPDSPHVAWQNAAFHAYADYMDTAEFQTGFEEFFKETAGATTAFMCAEGLWWRCHRRLLSDRLLALGHSVNHIMPNGSLVEHELPSFARIVESRIIYDGAIQKES
ncbi:MAG TPA: DUF488 domain-containing protein [Candidatus Binataceae bacterium]|nr:DUF488 domain-containing protein [Candidatus Binataceae bacterium]